MSYYYQIYTGSAMGRKITLDEVVRRLPERKYIDALIVGWSEDMELYRKLRSYTKQEGIALWLWFPVFSEHTMRNGFRQQVNIRTGKPFTANVFDGDETFDFCCPSEKRIFGELLKIYDSIYSSGGFDGIFLDRIRYPSMTVGAEALFGCCCEDCLAWFEAKGLSKNEIFAYSERLKRRIENPECANPLQIESYYNGNYTFSDPVITKLLALKRDKITNILKKLADEFRKRGLLVGMDLFAPFLSAFVGQDYQSLGAMADFAKPMLYRNTYTPAGIRYEIDTMSRALSSGTPGAFQKRKSFLESVLDLHDDGLDFFRRELAAIKNCEYGLGAKDRFIPGIELHTAKGNPSVSSTDICTSVRILEEAGFRSRVACWDILCAQDPAMKAFSGLFGGEKFG